MKISEEVEFKIGQFVYIKTDPDKHKRIVTSIIIRPNEIMYELCFIESISCHYDFEITDEIGELL